MGTDHKQIFNEFIHIISPLIVLKTLLIAQARVFISADVNINQLSMGTPSDKKLTSNTNIHQCKIDLLLAKQSIQLLHDDKIIIN